MEATRHKGKRIAVFGLARSGHACIVALMRGGAEVFAWDDSEPAREKAAADRLPVHDLHALDFSTLDALVLSPGVPLTHPEPHWSALKAKAAGIPVIGDTELFAREIEGTGARMVAITGTNGKSTTTALIGHILTAAGRDAHVGGNIGKAVFLLPPPVAGRIYVLELSSFQIDLMPGLKPDAGILMNVTPDHLDRHGTIENYAAVKARMFARQGPEDTAIIGVDDEYGVAIADGLNTGAKLVRMSSARALKEGVSAPDGVVFRVEGGREVESLDVSNMSALRGAHNWQNACAAYAACRAMGLSRDEIALGMASFPGLAHRMEEVATMGQIHFVNDSKATNADAAAKALASFRRIYWIAGGLAKQGGIDSLRAFFPRIAKSYLIGAAAPEFAATIGNAMPVEISGTLAQAVAAAARDAFASGEPACVLFSPAAASFDLYPNFEVRGEAFRSAVAGLGGIRMKGG